MALDCDRNNLVTELSRGRELARQLQIHLNVSSSSHETRELLVHKILNSYDKVMTMLESYGPSTMGEPQTKIAAIVGHSDSPGSFSGSPKSEDSDRDFKDNEVKTESKKRKSMPRWTKQVQECPGTGPEGRPLDDGFSWRKYGQKDILGAKYTRSYYRCTHRNIQGCLATKQVQRSDDDPTVFEITYRGRHTCSHNSQLTQSIQQSPFLEKKLEPNATLSHQPQQNQHRNQSQEILLSFKTSLKVITEDLQTQNLNIPSNKHFDCPSTSSVSGENIFISPKMTENNFPGNYLLPQNIPPATSLSNHNFVSPSQIVGFGEACEINGFDSELMDIVSVPTSANNSPNMGLDFLLGPIDPSEPSFSLDSPSFFCNF